MYDSQGFRQFFFFLIMYILSQNAYFHSYEIIKERYDIFFFTVAQFRAIIEIVTLLEK